MIVLINLDVPKRIFYKELTIGEDMNHPTANELRIGQYQNLLKTNMNEILIYLVRLHVHLTTNTGRLLL